MSVEVADESEFDPRMLDNVHVLFLCNVYRLTEERLRAIAEWVRRGGGLVIFPGDQVDGGYWNETARTAAPGLLPLKFVEMAGDQSEREWQVLRLSRPEHPVLQAFTGDNNPFLQRVKIFRYWNLEPAADATVLATLGNGRPALVETLYGTGRVLTFATAADAEWNNWPSDPSYVVTLQQVARCAARAASQTRSLAAGQPLRHEVSPALYRNEGRLFAPGAEESELLRATASTNLAMINFESAPLKQAGIWSLALTSHEGEEVRVPFAVNIEAAESEMEAADPRELLRRAGDDRIRFIEGPEIPTPEEAGGTRSELTRLLAALLIAALLIEQGLAWWFGKRRRA
jgi:hypothetical protein